MEAQMSSNKHTEKPCDAVKYAGTALLFLTQSQMRADGPSSTAVPLSDETYKMILADARNHLERSDHTLAPHTYAAVRYALATLEEAEAGHHDKAGMQYFQAHTEAILGGQRDIDLGGKKIANKPAVKEAFLRAAAITLWLEYPERRDALTVEAKKLLGVPNKNAFAKLVDNFGQRHDVQIEQSNSPLSIHIPFVSDLVKNHGYHNLRDFI